jgi:uncharacterized membrane protein
MGKALADENKQGAQKIPADGRARSCSRYSRWKLDPKASIPGNLYENQLTCMNISLALPALNPVYTHQSLLFIVERLLRRNGFPVNRGLLEEKLYTHPDFPTLLCVSDVLAELGVVNQAFKTDINTLLGNYTGPVLIVLKERDGGFAVIENIKDAKITLLTESGDNRRVTAEELAGMWDHTVLALEAGAKGAGVPGNNFLTGYPEVVRAGVFAFVVLAAAYIPWTLSEMYAAPQLVLLLVQSIGGLICWVLVLQHLHEQNLVSKQLCQRGTKAGCDPVLRSSYAMLVPWLSFAEAGLFYFAGTTCLLLFFNYPVLFFILALIAPLFSLYAFFVQGVLIRQWCRLCMAVHGTVFTSLALTLLSYPALVKGAFTAVMPQLLVFILPAYLWILSKPVIQKLRGGEHFKREYKKLKASPAVFRATLQATPKVHVPEELKVFTVGEKGTDRELVVVSNPYCGPCAQVHSLLHEWLKTEVDFQITFIFFHEAGDENRQKKFVEYLSGITCASQLRLVLHEWFRKGGQQDVEAWAQVHHLERVPLPYEDTLLHTWLKQARVFATPTIFVNGYRLPHSYRLEEIRYLIANQ